MPEMSEKNVSRTLEARRQQVTGDESLTPSRALRVAREIMATFTESGFRAHIQFMPRNPSARGRVLNLVRISPESEATSDLNRLRLNIDKLEAEKLYEILKPYEEEKNKVITPGAVAAAEECVRRFSASPPPARPRSKR